MKKRNKNVALTKNHLRIFHIFTRHQSSSDLILKYMFYTKLSLKISPAIPTWKNTKKLPKKITASAEKNTRPPDPHNRHHAVDFRSGRFDFRGRKKTLRSQPGFFRRRLFRFIGLGEKNQDGRANKKAIFISHVRDAIFNTDYSRRCTKNRNLQKKKNRKKNNKKTDRELSNHLHIFYTERVEGCSPTPLSLFTPGYKNFFCRRSKTHRKKVHFPPWNH